MVYTSCERASPRALKHNDGGSPLENDWAKKSVHKVPSSTGLDDDDGRENESGR
jgi:hypothetical protein